MFKRIDIISSLKFGALAAVLFAIPVLFYILDGTYAQSWLLYLGSFLFFVVVTIYTIFFNKVKGGDASTVTLIWASHVVTIIGVIISCILCFIMLATLVPGYLESGPAGVASPDNPPNTIQDKTNGLSFRIFMGATIINFAFASSAGIIYPFSVKRNQTKDAKDPFPLHQQGRSS